jgi:hypothetical protein
MDITNPDHIIVRKNIRQHDGRNVQLSIERSWLADAGYKNKDSIPVFLHVPTNAIVLLPKRLAANIIDAKKMIENTINELLAPTS